MYVLPLAITQKKNNKSGKKKNLKRQKDVKDI